MTEQKKLLKKIQQVSFVLYEVGLYLDTHPGCRQAMAYFDRYNRQYQELVSRYEARFGPLTMCGRQEGCERWQWVETPWPWELTDENASCDSGKGGNYRSAGKGAWDCGCP